MRSSSVIESVGEKFLVASVGASVVGIVVGSVEGSVLGGEDAIGVLKQPVNRLRSITILKINNKTFFIGATPFLLD